MTYRPNLRDGGERIIRFFPAWDKRAPAPAKNYGIHGVEVAFVLRGSAGAVSFVISTNWQLPHVQAERDSRPPDPDPRLWYFFHKPNPAYVSYHAIERRHEYEDECERCEWLDGEPCYIDATYTGADPVFERLLREGDEGVWAALEELYREWLSDPVDSLAGEP